MQTGNKDPDRRLTWETLCGWKAPTCQQKPHPRNSGPSDWAPSLSSRSCLVPPSESRSHCSGMCTMCSTCTSCPRTNTTPSQDTYRKHPTCHSTGEEQWAIERFVNSCWFWNHFQLKIQWEGYGEEHNKCRDYNAIEREAAAGPQDIDLVDKYYQRHQNTL